MKSRERHATFLQRYQNGTKTTTTTWGLASSSSSSPGKMKNSPCHEANLQDAGDLNKSIHRRLSISTAARCLLLSYLLRFTCSVTLAANQCHLCYRFNVSLSLSLGPPDSSSSCVCWQLLLQFIHVLSVRPILIGT